MKRERIGTIALGIDGLDVYYLLTLEETEEEPYLATAHERLDFVKEAFLPSVYAYGTGPGSRFCHTVLVSPKQYSDTEFIGIAQVRYDV